MINYTLYKKVAGFISSRRYVSGV